MTYLRVIYAALQIFTITTLYTYGAQIPMATHSPSLLKSSSNNVEPTVRIQCMSGSMLITIKDAPANYEGLFSGMIYPKGLSKNSTCLSEYRDHEGPLRYKLPLRSCNTMPQETDDGGIEFFNTIVLQPHLKLVTDMGRGYHVRCRYKSRDVATNNKWRTSITKHGENAQPLRSNEDDPDTYKRPGDRRDFGRALDKSNDDNENDDSINDIRMPGCHMKIYNELKRIAENANIGDPLTIVINIDKQDMYGLRITDCLVRDGLGWGEQRLVGDDGCPMDNEIMGQFQYSEDRLSANVTFPAHKFPYTASVYYQCNVKLCSVKSPECRKPLECTENAKRPKRQATTKDDGGVPATIEVYSGLYVNENADATEKDEDSVRKEKTMDDALCVSQRTFAIAIAIAGLILMLAVVAAVVCIMARRRTKTVSTSGSSIYSGPYTNTAFSHSS